MSHNLFQLENEQQIRYVAKLMGLNDQADLKDLPTATIRDMLGKANDKAYICLLEEIRKMMKFGNEYKKLKHYWDPATDDADFGEILCLIDKGGGQTCNVLGVLRELTKAGFLIKRKIK